ncbi:MAG TPA: MFS transporter [Chloroflexota bacterium]|nr:MFS transporter [Chloroflexota bacterium]
MRLLRRLLPLWLAGISIRITVLSIPPLLPAIHDRLHLDEKAVGLLTALPVLLLALAAVLGALVIHRLGARLALLLGLAGIALAGAARGIGPSVYVLFPMTFLMGCGIAICQPALPALVAQWLPERVPLGTATYSNGLLVAEALGAGLTLPLILPAVGGSWPLALACWSLFVVFTMVVVAAITRPVPVEAWPARQWWPAWQDPQTWKLGLLMGMGAIPYWVPNAFLPDFLRSAGHSELIAVTLTSLNLAQLPASFVVALVPRLVQRRWPLVLGGVLILAATAGLLLSAPTLAPIWAAALGFVAGMHFILNLALTPLIADPGDVHRLSAGIFSISYSLTFLAPLVGGALWDATGARGMGFLPVLVGAACVVLLASITDLRRGSSRPSVLPALV